MSDTGKVKIHGKEYLTVAYRVQSLKSDFPNFSIETEIVSRDHDCVVMKAIIKNEQGRVLATGHSEEYREASTINKTSALENSETSAIGRALAAFGLGGTEFASADEVAHAITKKGIHKPSDGAMESLDADMQLVVTETAQEVAALMGQGKVAEAANWFEAAMLGTDAKVACWALLPSDYRSALKKHQELKKTHKAVAAMKDDLP